MSKTSSSGLNTRIRQFHRVVSGAFIVCVIANFAVRMTGTSPAWVTYSPLIPLAALSLTGLYMLALPYASRLSNSRVSRL